MNSAIANLINEVDDFTDIYDMLSQKHKDKLFDIIVESKNLKNMIGEMVDNKFEEVEEEEEEVEEVEEVEVEEDEIMFYWDKQDEEEVEEEVVKLSFYQKNKDRILSETRFCDVCNKDVRKLNFTRHCKTKRHLKNIIQE
jgi:hypothetical protein